MDVAEADLKRFDREFEKINDEDHCCVCVLFFPPLSTKRTQTSYNSVRVYQTLYVDAILVLVRNTGKRAPTARLPTPKE